MANKPAPSQFVEQFHEVFRALGPIESRRMFGGHGIYHQGLIFGIAVGATVYLKTDAASAAEFKAAGCLPFEYEKKGVVTRTSYCAMPTEAFDDAEVARKWALLAFEASLRSRMRQKIKTRGPSK